MKYIDHDRHRFGVEPICRALGVSSRTYRAKKSRSPSKRAVDDELIFTTIQEIRKPGRFAYGAKKTWIELVRHGHEVGRCRVERIMRERGERGKRPGWKKRFTTVPDPAAERPPDLVERDFTAGPISSG